MSFIKSFVNKVARLATILSFDACVYRLVYTIRIRQYQNWVRQNHIVHGHNMLRCDEKIVLGVGAVTLEYNMSLCIKSSLSSPLHDRLQLITRPAVFEVVL